MDIIPAIDLLDGNCVRLNQGNYNKVTEFNTDPIKQALQWQEQGAKLIHLVDLDGAKTGLPINNKIIQRIKESIDIPIQIGGGIRSMERAQELLEFGIDRIILGTAALENQTLVRKLAKNYPDRIVVGIDSKNGKVATHGWISQSNIYGSDLARELDNSGITAIICTDIATDGTLNGPNLSAMKEIANSTQIPIIASGGVANISDIINLMTLAPDGICGVIIGRALYDGNVDLKEAIKAVKHGYIKDIKDKTSIYT